MKRFHIPVALALLALASSSACAEASAAARLTYEQTIAQCNSANMPRPERNACIRDAGEALTRAGGGQIVESQDPNPDARSTVIGPDGTPRRSEDSDSTYTTRDGRAVVVPPAGK